MTVLKSPPWLNGIACLPIDIRTLPFTSSFYVAPSGDMPLASMYGLARHDTYIGTLTITGTSSAHQHIDTSDPVVEGGVTYPPYTTTLDTVVPSFDWTLVYHLSSAPVGLLALMDERTPGVVAPAITMTPDPANTSQGVGGCTSNWSDAGGNPADGPNPPAASATWSLTYNPGGGGATWGFSRATILQPRLFCELINGGGFQVTDLVYSPDPFHSGGTIYIDWAFGIRIGVNDLDVLSFPYDVIGLIDVTGSADGDLFGVPLVWGASTGNHDYSTDPNPYAESDPEITWTSSGNLTTTINSVTLVVAPG
jgi:hypothetical protein